MEKPSGENGLGQDEEEAVASLLGFWKGACLSPAGALGSFRSEKSRGENRPRGRGVAAPTDHAHPLGPPTHTLT